MYGILREMYGKGMRNSFLQKDVTLLTQKDIK